MKKYTLQDFNSFEVIDGFIQCPTGDYTAIKEFPNNCIFGSNCEFRYGCQFGYGCKFGNNCQFGNNCKFGSNCQFGSNCEFGNNCEFGSNCKFGNYCEFGSNCKFGNYCKFGSNCEFGNNCVFGSNCEFGNNCVFGSNCEYNGVKIKNRNILSVYGVGKTKTISAWLSIDDTWHFQIGCRFGDEGHCRDAINEKYGEDHVYHKALDLLKMMDAK